MKVLNANVVGYSYPNSVFCARPSKYGNPFRIGPDGSRSEVIYKYEQWFLAQPGLVKQAKQELKGKNLICWCAPKPCHCDVLLRVANQSSLNDFFS